MFNANDVNIPLKNRKGKALTTILILFLLFLMSAGVCAFQTPAGYNDYEYQKLVQFFEIPNGAGKNGHKLSPNYDPEDPGTWGGDQVCWWTSGSNKKISRLYLKGKGMVGELDLSDFKLLYHLWVAENSLTGKLDVSGCEALEHLWFDYNAITEVDTSGCTNLGAISCDNNRLTHLELSHLSHCLSYLRCHDNQLTELDLNGFARLLSFWCERNLLTKIDIRGCTALYQFYCTSNQLTEIPFSDTMYFKTFECSFNELSFANLPLPVYVNPDNFKYSPQRPFPIAPGDELIAGLEVNLSAEATIGGIDTNYIWYNGEGEEITPTTAHNGRFTFDQSFEGQTIYCQMTNETYPLLAVETKKTLVIVPTSIYIVSEPKDILVEVGGEAHFKVVAGYGDGATPGTFVYQWQLSVDGGNRWTDVSATTDTLVIPRITYDNDGNQYRCKVTFQKAGGDPVEIISREATLTVSGYEISFIKPTTANDAGNPVNISTGSLVMAKIYGQINEISRLVIRIDDGGEQKVNPGEIVYFLLPADLSEGEHTLTIIVSDKYRNEFESSVTFHWDSYREGFGFGRFNFEEN